LSEQQAVDTDAIVLPEHEAKLEAAKSRGATDEEMQSLADEYSQARKDEYSRRNKSDDSDSTDSSDSDSEELRGEALDTRAAELNIEGRSQMTADEKREAIAAAEADENNGDTGAAPPQTF